MEALLGESRCHRLRQNFASALTALNVAAGNVSTESKFVVVDAADFFIDLAELRVIFGQVDLARAALKKVPTPRPEVEDKISYLSLCLTQAQAAMDEADDARNKTHKIRIHAWNKVTLPHVLKALLLNSSVMLKTA